MADFTSLNGYNVKDEQARADLVSLNTTVNTDHESRITDLETNLETLDTKVNTNHEGRITNLENLTNKKVIMIGDSYANRENSWQDKLKTYMGLSNADCNLQRISGTGFVNTVDNCNFITMLTEGITLNAEEVTDIIVCGGYNDKSYTQNAQLEAINSFMTTCKNIYPNANVYVGFVGWCNYNIEDYGDVVTSLIATRNNYKIGCMYYNKAHYLNNVEYSLHDLRLIDDSNFHPTQDGQVQLAYNIMSAWQTGTCNVLNSYNITDSFTTPNNITLNADDKLYSEINNGFSRIYSKDALRFTFDQTTVYDLHGDPIILGTLTKGYVYGRWNIIKAQVQVLVSTSNNGYVLAPAIIKISNGTLKLEMKLLKRDGTSWLPDDSLKYIHVYGFDKIISSMDQF